MSRVVIEDSYQRNARLGCCVGATSHDLAGHPARVFGHYFAKRVALDSNLLPGFDLVVQLDQKLNESAMSCKDSVAAVGDEDVRVLPGAAHRTGDNPVVLEHIHCAFHEQRDHAEVQDACSANLGRECRDAHIDECVREESGICGVVEDLVDGKELRHRPDFGQLHPGKIERCCIETCSPGMKIERV